MASPEPLFGATGQPLLRQTHSATQQITSSQFAPLAVFAFARILPEPRVVTSRPGQVSSTAPLVVTRRRISRRRAAFSRAFEKFPSLRGTTFRKDGTFVTSDRWLKISTHSLVWARETRRSVSRI